MTAPPSAINAVVIALGLELGVAAASAINIGYAMPDQPRRSHSLGTPSSSPNVTASVPVNGSLALTIREQMLIAEPTVVGELA